MNMIRKCAAAAVFTAVIGSFHVRAQEPPMPGRGERINARRENSERIRERSGERIEDIERKREQMSERMMEEREKIRELVIKHREARTDSEKDALKAELKNLIEMNFDSRHGALKERLNRLKEECSAIESRIQDNMKQKDEIISRHLDRLLEMPGRGKETPGQGGAAVRQRERRE